MFLDILITHVRHFRKGPKEEKNNQQLGQKKTHHLGWKKKNQQTLGPGKKPINTWQLPQSHKTLKNPRGLPRLGQSHLAHNADPHRKHFFLNSNIWPIEDVEKMANEDQDICIPSCSCRAGGDVCIEKNFQINSSFFQASVSQRD